jgi:hypothetical protein
MPGFRSSPAVAPARSGATGRRDGGGGGPPFAHVPAEARGATSTVPRDCPTCSPGSRPVPQGRAVRLDRRTPARRRGGAQRAATRRRRVGRGGRACGALRPHRPPGCEAGHSGEAATPDGCAGGQRDAEDVGTREPGRVLLAGGQGVGGGQLPARDDLRGDRGQRGVGRGRSHSGQRRRCDHQRHRRPGHYGQRREGAGGDAQGDQGAQHLRSWSAVDGRRSARIPAAWEKTV